MALDNFIPEIWSASLLSILDKSLVFGGVSNRNYEGEINDAGDTVHITDVDDVSIFDYDRNTDLATQDNLNTNEQLLLIDQAKAFNFQIDDIDKAQVKNGGGLMSEAARRAAFGLRDKADQFLAGKMAGAAGNGLGVIDGTTPANVYDKLIVPASVALDEASVPEELRWLVLAPSAYGQLQLDARFIKANESGTGALHNGVVGDAGGFRIYKSNNAFQGNRAVTGITAVAGPKTLGSTVAGTFSQGDVGLIATGTGVAGIAIVSVSSDGTTATLATAPTAGAGLSIVLSGGGQFAYAGSTIATTYAEQILKVVGYSPEKRFGDALKGLHVYGGRVIRPEALVVASVKTA